MNVQNAHEFLLKLRNDLLDIVKDDKTEFVQLPVGKVKRYIGQISLILNPNSEMDNIGKAREALSKGYRGNDTT